MTISLPLALTPPRLSRHFPNTLRVLPAAAVHCCLGAPLHAHRSTSLPLKVRPKKSSRHLKAPPAFLIGPVRTTRLTVQVNVADPDTEGVVSVAVTVTEETPGVVGVPESSRLALMDSPAGRPDAEKVSGLPSVENPLTCRLTPVPTVLVRLPGLSTPIASLGWQLPVELSHSGCWANVPQDPSVSVNSLTQAHLSPISKPWSSYQAEPGEGELTNGSVTDSMYSWPPTIDQPSNPFWTMFAPQPPPASGM